MENGVNGLVLVLAFSTAVWVVFKPGVEFALSLILQIKDHNVQEQTLKLDPALEPFVQRLVNWFKEDLKIFIFFYGRTQKITKYYSIVNAA